MAIKKYYMNLSDFDGENRIYEPTYEDRRLCLLLSGMKYKYSVYGQYFTKGLKNRIILARAKRKLKGLNPIAWSTALLIATGEDYEQIKSETIEAYQLYLPLKAKDIEPFI